MSTKTVEERLSILEYSQDDQERRIRNVESKTNSLERITTLIELQQEQNKEVKETLTGINRNLQNLNHDVKYMKDKQDIMDSRVSEIEKDKVEELENYKEKSIDFYLKVGAAIVIAGLLIFLGLK